MDMHHDEAIRSAGGDFFPLVVETFGVWAPSSLATLRTIASWATTYSGLPTHRALSNLLQQLSVTLWSLNAQMLRAQLDLE